MFIVLEGIDGAGKTTLARQLATRLHEHFKSKVQRVSDPSPGNSVSKTIRGLVIDSHGFYDPIEEAFLYAAARVGLVEKEIRPALKDGTIVVCDRYYWSSLAYQGAYLTHLQQLGVYKHEGISFYDDMDLIEMIALKSCRGVTPDWVFVVDIDPTVAVQRVRKRDFKASEPSDGQFQKFRQYREIFLQIPTWGMKEKSAILDGLLPTETLVDQIMARISEDA